MLPGDEEPPRLFTVEDANALLPTLRALLVRARDAHQRLAETAQELDALDRQRERATVVQLARPLRLARERLGADREALHEAVQAITAHGVQIKHLEPALLDFPAWRAGRIVLLCWREDEPSVSHWHERDTGFVGRQPL